MTAKKICSFYFIGFFGQGSSPQPQPQVVYQQAPPKKSGPGMGTALLAGKISQTNTVCRDIDVLWARRCWFGWRCTHC
jgi:hypothetical protein